MPYGLSLTSSGAMAGPMLAASVMPRSVTVPTVADSMAMLACCAVTKAAPDPVTVHCAVGVRTPPYSSG